MILTILCEDNLECLGRVKTYYNKIKIECHKSIIYWIGHILLYKIHMQAENSNKMDSNK
jgi:hypothetical protein